MMPNRASLHSRTALWVAGLLATVALLAASTAAVAQDQAVRSGQPQWIWFTDQAATKAPSGNCYFRKVFRLGTPEAGRIEIAADNLYELYVNGRLVGRGDNWKRLDVYDIQRYLVQGQNTIAVRAVNDEPGPAGLVALVSVRQRGNTDVSHSTDGSWKVSIVEQPNWQQRNFDDSRWTPARVLGEFGRTSPWSDDVQVAEGASSGRFKLPPNFSVRLVADPEETGSLIAMTFNERGEIIASRERGPLLLIRDEDGDGAPETVHVYSEQMTSCQGILALNGDVYAVGDGPEGTSFCRLRDENGDGKADAVETLLKFTGGMGEHGPHAPVLGPDGLIYIVVGNHSAVEAPFAETSPHRHFYEGDLVQPRYEDAGGHAVGIKSPGGTVIRTDTEGSFVELVAGGFRNAYDIAFNRQGDLFTFDSDMEWDEGLPWYRPTRFNHIIPGAEFGWRSGWAKWPDYYLDSLPATVDIGRGSPTGVVFYNHHNFPVRYHNALFAADWSLGRILVVQMEPAGGTYAAKADVFMRGRPLNVTDLEVGPDGWLYFSTGGRGTEGGIYCVKYDGRIPPRPEVTGITAALEQPQLYSAWGRDSIAALRQELGEQWDSDIREAAANARLPVELRTRALDLMHLVGPFPSTKLLVRISRESDPELRTKAAYLMGIHSDQSSGERLVELLEDPHPNVRRQACESLVRAGQPLPTEKLIKRLSESDRFVSWAARRALEHVPRSEWQSRVIEADDVRVFLVGATALLVMEPDRATADAVLDRCSRLMQGFVSDEDFLDLLRVTQLALLRAEIPGDDVPQLRSQLAEEYPALEPRMNRELLRLLVYLGEPSITARMIEELNRQDNPLVERLHLAFYARMLTSGWTVDEKLELLRFYETARTLPGGHSFSRYVDNVTRDFVAGATPEENEAIVAHAVEMPNAALTALAKLPDEVDAARLAQLTQLDRELKSNDSEAARMLGTGIVAVLARSGDPESMAYLRQVYEEDPDRRQDLAMGLAQQPGGENFPLLVSSLSIVENAAAEEVLRHLAEVDQTPEGSEPLRQAILCGLRIDGRGSRHAVRILEKWTGEKLTDDDASPADALAAWQDWFRGQYPDQPDPSLPVDDKSNRWTFDELLAHLTETDEGNHVRGQSVYEKAKCHQCHRYGNRGEGIGPDLTTVAQRFQTKEILESILFPSQVISDQYASKTIVTVAGRTFTGIVGSAGEGSLVVLQSNGEKVVIAEDDVDEIAPSKKSTMPEGLLNELTLEEIADLFTYLRRPPSGLTASAAGQSGR